MPGDRPTRATLIGLLVGSVIGLIAAQGPLVSAIRITIDVETQVGLASNLPDAWTLPATLEGLGAVALVYLVTVRPVGRMRTWCATLVVTTLLAGMAAQGSHALWFDQKTKTLALPGAVRLFISFVPPVSGGAALHLAVSMLEGLIGTIRLLAGSQVPVEPTGAPNPTPAVVQPDQLTEPATAALPPAVSPDLSSDEDERAVQRQSKRPRVKVSAEGLRKAKARAFWEAAVHGGTEEALTGADLVKAAGGSPPVSDRSARRWLNDWREKRVSLVDDEEAVQ